MSRLLSKGISKLNQDGLLGAIKSVYRNVNTYTKYLIAKTNSPQKISIGSHRVRIPIDSISIYKELSFYKENELEEVEDLLEELDPEDVFLDIGANMRIHSLFASKLAAETYSIEPHPVNLTHLCLNRHLNNANFEILSCALSAEKGYVKLPAPKNKSTVDGSASISDDTNEYYLYVNTEIGDSLLIDQELITPSIVKIDVEGAEKEVLRGLSETLERDHCRIVYCEIHETLGVEYEEIVDFLQGYGYNTEVIEEVSYGRTVKAKK